MSKKINYREGLLDDILKRVDMLNVDGTMERLVADIVFDVAHNVCSDIQDILHDVEDDAECCSKIQDYCMSVMCSEEEIESFNDYQEMKERENNNGES